MFGFVVFDDEIDFLVVGVVVEVYGIVFVQLVVFQLVDFEQVVVECVSVEDYVFVQVQFVMQYFVVCVVVVVEFDVIDVKLFVFFDFDEDVGDQVVVFDDFWFDVGEDVVGVLVEFLNFFEVFVDDVGLELVVFWFFEDGEQYFVVEEFVVFDFDVIEFLVWIFIDWYDEFQMVFGIGVFVFLDDFGFWGFDDDIFVVVLVVEVLDFFEVFIDGCWVVDVVFVDFC